MCPTANIVNPSSFFLSSALFGSSVAQNLSSQVLHLDSIRCVPVQVNMPMHVWVSRSIHDWLLRKERSKINEEQQSLPWAKFFSSRAWKFSPYFTAKFRSVIFTNYATDALIFLFVENKTVFSPCIHCFYYNNLSILFSSGKYLLN